MRQLPRAVCGLVPRGALSVFDRLACRSYLSRIMAVSDVDGWSAVLAVFERLTARYVICSIGFIFIREVCTRVIQVDHPHDQGVKMPVLFYV